MIFKKKKPDLPLFVCPLCEKQIEVKKSGFRGAADNAFVYHLRRCERYKALTAMAALFQGLRLPRYGGTLLQDASREREIERTAYDSAVEKFTEFMMQKVEMADPGVTDGFSAYDDIPIVRVVRLPELFALFGVRIKPDVP